MSSLPPRTLGRGDEALNVSALGLGCLGMSEFYGATDEAEAICSLDPGVTHLDTADLYGPHTNEELMGRASPLGRGFPSGSIRSLDDLDEDDVHRFSPRFQGYDERGTGLVDA